MNSHAGATNSKKKNPALLIIGAAVLVLSCIPCIGIVAAVGMPAFIGYVRRSKTAEAEANLRAMATGAAAYYAQEQMGPGGAIQTRCTVGPEITPYPPSSAKQVLGPLGPSFTDIGFGPADPVFYQYEIVAGPASCGHGPGEPLYTFFAYGDLDDDGLRSSFSITVGTDAMGEFSAAPSVTVVDELE